MCVILIEHRFERKAKEKEKSKSKSNVGGPRCLGVNGYVAW
jgi:hypothetical protein